MEWWPVNPDACTPAAQTAGSQMQFVAEVALDQQLPALLQHQQPPQQQQPQEQQQQQPQEQDQAAAEFDPWLACDDLELGTIIQQVNSGVLSSPSSDGSMNQTALVLGSVKQGEPFGDSNNLPSLQARRGSENKQHIINIINNSLPAAYQHSSGQQQQARNNSMAASSSIASSPLSSSLGSSPLNSLSSNYSSLSPHSPLSASFNLAGSHQQQHQHQQQQQQQHQHQHQPHSNQTYPFGNNDDFHRHQQQHVLPFGNSNARLIVPTSGSSNIVSSTRATINSTQSGTKLSIGAGSRYNQPRSTVSSSQQPGAGLGGSSLLTTTKAQAKVSGRQARKTTATSSITDTSNLAAQAHKQRRCRHITDFVLAEEERRLLVKEGHTDFPTDCQLRPLTKMEERVLRKIRRKIRNKKSAQCSRQRKKEYVEELERKYAETVRENIELKQLLAKIHSTSEHHQESQFKATPVGADQMQSFGGDECGQPQTSCEADSLEMHWKDLFHSESVADRMNAVQRQQAQQTSISYD